MQEVLRDVTVTIENAKFVYQICNPNAQYDIDVYIHYHKLTRHTLILLNLVEKRFNIQTLVINVIILYSWCYVFYMSEFNTAMLTFPLLYIQKRGYCFIPLKFAKASASVLSNKQLYLNKKIVDFDDLDRQNVLYLIGDILFKDSLKHPWICKYLEKYIIYFSHASHHNVNLTSEELKTHKAIYELIKNGDSTATTDQFLYNLRFQIKLPTDFIKYKDKNFDVNLNDFSEQLTKVLTDSSCLVLDLTTLENQLTFLKYSEVLVSNATVLEKTKELLKITEASPKRDFLTNLTLFYNAKKFHAITGEHLTVKPLEVYTQFLKNYDFFSN